MMGKVYCFIVLLFVCYNVSAQNTLTKVDSIKKDNVGMRCVSTIMPGKEPLVIIDDKAITDNSTSYSDALKSINPAEIMSVSVLKDAAATAIYGVRGINGVIVIITKHNQKIDSLIKINKGYPTLSDSVMYVIDGIISPNKLQGINSSSILSIDILKKSEMEKLNWSPKGDAVAVITKDGARKSYQKKLAAFSAPYKKYLDDYNGNDIAVLYVIDDDVNLDKNEMLNNLYKLPKEKIATVKLNQKETCCGTNFTVIINTKK